ncbi:related to Sel-1 homolog precursor [Melanopsichium pennsylvanicum]|uniref:Related to Sel-1 homolog n=2 Tax=Melanopsichium pennsylvanicum TaxID=63383 RepID=A0AAJ5C4Q6_9BASI|nr:related to Sel-1 homolog precursor [Melanopsichium pennsylvanicum 4]SNX83941.1 related to Sel-1 homolog precursor [Melanopsichium pennsylvanicum]
MATSSDRRSVRRSKALLTLLVATCLLSVTLTTHAEQVPFTPSTNLKSVNEQTPHEAYEVALRLLRVTIKTKAPLIKISKGSPKTSSSQSQQDEATTVSSKYVSLAELARSLRRWVADLFDAANDAASYDAAVSAKIKGVGPTKSDGAHRWQGPPVDASQHESQWPSAGPLLLWPDWEILQEGAAPANPADSVWESIMFGPFNSKSKAPSDLALSPQTDSESGEGGEPDRLAAVSLLTKAGWGRDEVDWQYEAYSSTARNASELLRTAFIDVTSTNQSSVGRETALADALWVLGEHSLWGTHGSQPNLARARACYQRLADFGHDQFGISMAGNASAHARLAFLEGSGWESTVRGDWKPLPNEFSTWSSFSSPSADDVRSAWKRRRELFAQLKTDDGQRQAKAVLHYTIAANAGHAPSQMALGFRYKQGIGVTPSCWNAVELYEKAAEDTYKRFQAGPPGGLTLPYTKIRISDLDGGAYGPGASVASTGYAAALNPAVQVALNRQPGSARDPSALEDLLEYHIYLAEHGDVRSTLFMAQVYYHGSIYSASEAAGAVRRDYRRALTWLLRVAKEVWPRKAGEVGRGGPTGFTAKEGDKGEDVQLKVDDSTLAHAGSAAGMIGKMYLRGEGVQQDFRRAWVWFSRGQSTGDAESYNGLGIMLRDGLGTKTDIATATTYFEAAAKVKHSGANVNLAKIHMDMGDLDAAAKCLTIASVGDSRFEAVYLLAKVNAKLAREKQSGSHCRTALAGFKHTAEHGDWSTRISHKAEYAWRRGERQKALLGWSLAGEMGYESAQNNVAYMLDRANSRTRILNLALPNTEAHHEGNFTDRLALVHWTRSAAQQNVDAMVKMGDYYFHGIGTGNPGQPAYEKAAACYSAAADRGVSALAYWNLGWMYENGIGVARQDFHLAKRYYDVAVATNDEAYLPVALSLVKLHIRAVWAALFRSESSQSAISLLSSYTSSGGGKAAFTEAEEQAAAMQKKEEERQKRIAEEQGGGYGDPNEPETWAARDGETDEDLDDMIESGFLILALGALAYLAYMRQNVQLQLRREQRNQDRQQGDEQQQPVGHQPNPWAPLGNEPNAAANLIAGL